ncbi:MAG: flagellar protein FlgN [Bdellovibrionaceae bacterium]|nr:flagellar protein FlgN [Pseudobdellovibrionaceae bacterium]
METKTQEIYSSLVENLDNLVKVYRSLLDIVRKEKDILVSAKLDDLNENNKAKDAMLVRIRSLENTRLKLARDLSQSVGADIEAPRLLDIATRIDAERAQRLRNLHSVLDLLVKRVSEVNRQNEELVKSALSSITGAMEAIRDTLQEKPTYARKGQMAAAPSGGALVRKEV